jgi:hypothetical protein
MPLRDKVSGPGPCRLVGTIPKGETTRGHRHQTLQIWLIQAAGVGLGVPDRAERRGKR